MAQRPCQRTKRRRIIVAAIYLLTIIAFQVSFASAQSTSFEEILRPLETIYDLVKYAATVIAGLVMLFAGITYISSGSDPGKREKAKNMVMYVFIGLIVIWAAPFVVDLILDT
jgi:cation transport ATPase